MSGKRILVLAAAMMLLAGSGCCRMCDRWCNRGTAVPCCPCPAPACAPACPPGCAPTGPTCYTPGAPATVASGTQWQRTPNGCCP